MKSNNYAVIMAGGVGSRFWPVSKQDNPKQFQDILGTGKSLLQTTFDRLKKIIPSDQIYILTNTIYRDIVTQQLPEITPQQVVLEPVMRNTAPCILLAAMKIYKRDPKAKMIVAPSDHWIQTEAAFATDMQKAFKAIENQDILVTFGIKPTFPNTGYGYINYSNSASNDFSPVLRFTEKPDIKTAQRFLKDGNYLWNSGIFVWKAAIILEHFQEFLPEMYQLFGRSQGLLNTSDEPIFLRESYHQVASISIDYGIIEKSTNVYVIPASFQWNDLGTWGSVQTELQHDSFNNTVINSNLIALEAEGNIVRTETDKIVLVDGLKDYMILENNDVLLIVPKHKEQQIKEFREDVMHQFGMHLG